MKRSILQKLSLPLTRGLDIDDPATTNLRRDIIRSKPFLRRLYLEWYEILASPFDTGDRVLELGSGAGFLKERLPDAITSDLLPIEGVERVENAMQLSFGDEWLDGIVMINVLHHLPDVGRFLSEAERTLKPGGRIVMVEPWNNRWSNFIYRHLHHEPFEPMSSTWGFEGAGPLSDANGALPWIVFQRDRSLLGERFPKLSLQSIRPIMPLAYLLSGGVSYGSFAPAWAYRTIRRMERLFGEQRNGMFAAISLTKTAAQSGDAA
jgi:SAM-dependent methyltransferase